MVPRGESRGGEGRTEAKETGHVEDGAAGADMHLEGVEDPDSSASVGMDLSAAHTGWELNYQWAKCHISYWSKGSFSVLRTPEFCSLFVQCQQHAS